MTSSTTPSTRRLRIEDLLDVAVPSQPALSPDGSRVAYVLRTLDAAADRNVDELWLVADRRAASRAGSPTVPPTPHPVWSPDGSRLAFLRDGQVAVLDARAARPRCSPTSRWARAHRGGARTDAGSPSPHRSTRRRGDGPMVTDGLDYQADGAGMFGAVRSQLHVLDLETGRGAAS